MRGWENPRGRDQLRISLITWAGLPGIRLHPALLCVGGTSSSDISRRSTTL